MPYRSDNRAWIREQLGAVRPEWNGTLKRWEIAKEHLWPLVGALADRFGAVEVYLEFSEHSRCDQRCRDANPETVWDCVCSCLGENHGGVAYWKTWHEVAPPLLVSTTRHTQHLLFRRGSIPAYLLPDR
jgi:hypothetical protein